MQLEPKHKAGDKGEYALTKEYAKMLERLATWFLNTYVAEYVTRTNFL